MIIAEDNKTQHRPHINQGAQVRSQPLEKPTRIDCDYCPRTFSTKGNLNRHCRQSHSEDQTWHQYHSGPNNSDIARVKLERLDLTRSKIKPDDPIEERRITLLQNVSNKMIYDVADVAETTTSDYSNGAANIRIDSDLTKNIYPCKFGSCKEKTYKTKSHVYEHYSLVHRRDKLARYIQKGNKCNIVNTDGSICKTVFQDDTAKIRHLGTVHRMVEKFLPKSLWLDLRGKGSHCRKRKRRINRKQTDQNKENFENKASIRADVTYGETEDTPYVVNPENVLVLNEIVDHPEPAPSFNIRDIFDENDDDL